jgi:monoamine oxidase
MGRTPLFDVVARSIHTALSAEERGIPTGEVLDRRAEHEAARLRSRRTFIAQTGVAAAAATVAALGTPPRAAIARAGAAGPSIGIVGAGLAGLVCGDELRKSGILATIYEAGDRVGGRCASLSGFFPGQVAERGGEFIDNLHKTMLGYVQRFGLTREDVEKAPGEVSYFIDNRLHPEAAVVDEFRAFVPALRGDAGASSGAPTADRHTPEDVRLDRISLAAYLDGANSRRQPASRLIREVLVSAYEGEYGLNADEQSCLNLILFIHADRRSKFRPFGIYSDERWHVVEGNGRVAEGLAGLLRGQIELAMNLVALRKTGAGRVELTFNSGGRTITRMHDAVVLTIPFTVLRDVSLHATLQLPDEKLRAIRQLGYGTNVKTMVGFSGRPWAGQGASGTVYANLPNVQIAWETNPINATPSRAILTDYASGRRGVMLGGIGVQEAAGRFLTDLDRVFAGANVAATRTAGRLLVHRDHWPSNPLAKGSYTCYRPGQFTTIAGNEGKPAGNVYFAGEHTNSFYEWQGFMEGACLSGIQAASQVLADIRAGRL